MKKTANLLVCAFLAVTSLASCRNEEVQVYSISVDPAELSFGYDGGKQTVEVTSSHKWTLTNDSDWITTSADEGESGSLVEISAGHNTSADIKYGEIIFTCGDKTAVLKVSQEIDGNRTIQFKDPNFLEALIAENVDDNGDGQITVNEAKSVKSLEVRSSDIKEMPEIRYFTALTVLYCDGNQLTDLDVSNNTALTKLICSSNQLTALDVSNNTALTWLNCYNNQLTTLDVSNNTALTKLNCRFNQLTTLDVSNNTALTDLSCDVNQLTTLDVSNNTALTDLWCHNNQLTTLDVSNNTALTDLWCYDNQLTTLDVSNNTALTELDCYYNQLTTLDVSNNTALTVLNCRYNQLTTLDVSNNTALTELNCSSNQLTTLDVSNNTALTDLSCYYNPLLSVTISESQINASWMNDVRQNYPDIEIIVK